VYVLNLVFHYWTKLVVMTYWTVIVVLSSSEISRLTLKQTVPYDLLERGYTNQVCIDFSKVVVDLMKSRHSDKPQVEWRVGDVRNMIEVNTESVDVAFDKGTLDAMIYGSPWSPPEEVLENSGKYMKEVSLVKV
jgi:hypothetical protein